jgi:hypothetical protein
MPNGQFVNFQDTPIFLPNGLKSALDSDDRVLQVSDYCCIAVTLQNSVGSALLVDRRSLEEIVLGRVRLVVKGGDKWKLKRSGRAIEYFPTFDLPIPLERRQEMLLRIPFCILANEVDDGQAEVDRLPTSLEYEVSSGTKLAVRKISRGRIGPATSVDVTGMGEARVDRVGSVF